MTGKKDAVECAMDAVAALLKKKLVPRGKLTCYESVAGRLGMHARTVGWACWRLGKKYRPLDMPYHRIICKDGKLPKRFSGPGDVEGLRELLQKEGHKVKKKLKGGYRVLHFKDCLGEPASRRKK
jgi:alkylated DNA nucleotide flippase Atl1